MATVQRRNKSKTLTTETLAVSDVLEVIKYGGAKAIITYEDLLDQLSGAISGGGVGVGSDGEIDLGDRMTGNDIMDLGNRV
jgi:hypothetical protein